MSGWKPDEIDPERVPDIARRMLREFRPAYDRIAKRREHRFTEEAADPVLSQRDGDSPAPNDLFSQASRYQAREISITGKRLVDRICENPWQAECKAPDETAALEKIANNVTQVDNSWGIEIEERQAMSVQRALADSCVYDMGYAVFHLRRCEDLWPEIDWSNKPTDEGMAEVEEERECPGCGGAGFDERDAEPCPQCEGKGVVKRAKLTFKGTGKGYVSAVQYEYAKRGAPWTWEVVDPLNFAWRTDKDPRGGLFRALVHYEVLLEDYIDSLGDDPTVEKLRALSPLPGSQHGEFYHDSPGSQDIEGKRVTVYQLWTRSHLYEWCGESGASSTGNGVVVKNGPHGYPRIPFRIAAPRRTGHADIMRAFECDMDDMYAVKPWADKQITLFGAAMENTVQPLVNETYDDPTKAPILMDGAPESGGRNGQSVVRPAGVTAEVVSAPLPPSIPAFWQELKEQMERAKPDTGDVDVGATSQAWAIRLGQAQAGKGPRAHVVEHSRTLQWAFQFIHDWHEQNAEPMVAFGRDHESRAVSTSKPIVIEPGELSHIQPTVYINPVSAAEKQMEEEQARGLLAERLITPEDFYKVRGERDPADAALRNRAYWVAQPYIDQHLAGRVAERMGSMFLVGPQGELMNGAGQAVSPDQVLAAKGYTPAVPATPNAPGAGGAPPMNGNMLGQIRGQVQMPALPALQGAGANVAPLPGVPG